VDIPGWMDLNKADSNFYLDANGIHKAFTNFDSVKCDVYLSHDVGAGRHVKIGEILVLGGFNFKSTVDSTVISIKYKTPGQLYDCLREFEEVTNIASYYKIKVPKSDIVYRIATRDDFKSEDDI